MTALTPDSGPVGTQATISLSSTTFPLAGDYKVRWSSSAGFEEEKTMVLKEGVLPPGTMNVALTITVPETKFGLNYVQFQRLARDDPTNIQFNVKPSLVITPTSSSPGATVTIKGMGFPDNDVATVTFDGARIDIPVNTNAVGTFSMSYVIPVTIAGEHRFIASTEKLATMSGSARFDVGPAVKMTPDKPDIGAEVTLTGAGFAGSSSITVKYDGQPVANPPTTDAKGNFVFKFKIPDASGKSPTIIVTDKFGNIGTFGMPLETTAPPKPAIVSPKDKDQRFGMFGDATIEFKWSAVTDPSGVFYTVEVGDSLNFFPLKPGLRKTGLTQNSVKISVPQGTYFWRVKAIDGAGNEGEWVTSPYFFNVGMFSFWYLIIGGIVVLVVFILLLRAFFKRLRDYYG